MSEEENPNPVVPTPFRGLRVLLVDNDTASLLNIAKELEKSSYRVTTTEIATVALSILQERKDRFDLIMADTNMPEMDFFIFIKRVHLIKDFPIILMSSSELNKDMVKEAMVKGACFFLKKPISLKNLKNVWQHVFRRQSNYENIRTKKAVVTESNADQEADESKGDKVGNDKKTPEIADESDQIENDQDNKRLTTIRTKRPMSTQNDEPGDKKRRKTKNGVIDDAKGKRDARPGSVLEIMKKPNLTRRRFLSGLQKYRVESPSIKLNRAASLSGDRTKILERLSNSNSSYNEREFISVTPSTHPGVGSIEMDEIQAFTGSSRSLSTFYEGFKGCVFSQDD